MRLELEIQQRVLMTRKIEILVTTPQDWTEEKFKKRLFDKFRTSISLMKQLFHGRPFQYLKLDLGKSFPDGVLIQVDTINTDTKELIQALDEFQFQLKNLKIKKGNNEQMD